MTITRLRLATFAVAVAAVLLVPAAQAGTLTVNTDSDADDGTDGVCSLREAMQAAFLSANYNECTHSGGTGEPHVINFSNSFTITVGSTPFPEVVNDVTVNGLGQSVVIDGDDANRPLNVDGGDLTLLNLTVQFQAKTFDLPLYGP